jgi:amino acid transporter
MAHEAGDRPAGTAEPRHAGPGHPALRRALTLPYAVLYGMGVTIGAGIYVLIGAAAARAGMMVPLAFVVAAVLMGLTGASFAELGGRMPVAAGEAAYVRAGFRSERWSAAVGLLVVGIAVIAAAAIAAGSAGYVALFLDLPRPVIVAGVVLAMGAIAAWGIRESVLLAGAMTLVEIGGLMVMVAAGAVSEPELVARLPEMLPQAGPAALVGLIGASLLAVFAFIGFEALVNVAEELDEPERTLPRAIFLTLGLTTLLYVLVAWVAVVSVPPAELAASPAPMALAFERLTGASPRVMSAIAVVATLNGIIVQIILASRVLYGLSRQGTLPPALQEVSPATRTPLLATAVTAALVLAFALLLPLERLAEITSRLTLALFALVNLALVRIKARELVPPRGIWVVPAWVPWAALASCIALLAADLAVALASALRSSGG